MNNDITLFWALEDLKFDAFERSFLFHIFRRGVCWETQANIATQTGMSAGKVNGLIQMLSKRKIIIRGKASNGREGWVVNESLVRSLHEQLQQNGRSSDEYHSPHERDIHHMNDDIHHMNDDIHHMNTKDNKEDNTKDNKGKYIPPTPPPPDPWDDETEARAFELHQDAISFSRTWCLKTYQQLPHIYGRDDLDRRVNENFIGPAMMILQEVDSGKALDLCLAERERMLAKGLTGVRYLSAVVPQIMQDMESKQINKFFRPDEPKGYAAIRQVMSELESGEWSL